MAIASRNPGKIREILAICADWPVTWVSPEELPGKWPDIEESGRTYLENALLKARAVAEATGVPAVADDSGIEVDALGGGPGMRSARYGGEGATGEENLAKLLAEVVRVPSAERTARYRCVAAVAWPDGRTAHAEATCEGSIVLKPRGSGGFGYDPAFVPEGETRTMAELSQEEKDAISHRGKAFRALREGLE